MSRTAILALAFGSLVATVAGCATESPGTTGGDSEGDSEGDDGATFSEICEAYIDCVTAVTPGGVTPVIAYYGPEGECWDLPGVTPEDCADECEANHITMAQDNPSISECWMCTEDADCEVGAYCDEQVHTCTGSAPVLSCMKTNYCENYAEGVPEIEKDCSFGESSVSACPVENMIGRCIDITAPDYSHLEEVLVYAPFDYDDAVFVCDDLYGGTWVDP